MTQYTEIIKCIVELLLAVASAILIPYIKQKVSAAKLEKLIRYADIAVTAAQQIYTPEEWDIKKKYVQDFLTSKGYDINLTEVDAAIEAAVTRVKKELGA